jgi:hypothetical protein
MDRRQVQDQQQLRELPHLSHGIQSIQTHQSMDISSITAGNHLVNRVAAHMKVPYSLAPRKPWSQTLIQTPATTLLSVPITD